MTTYNEAVAEARTLVKRSENDQWRLAELTWDQIEAGATRSQWAKDTGVSIAHVARYYRIWARWGFDLEVRPSFNEAYMVIREGVDDPEEARRITYERQALGPIRNMPPERKAEVARELLADPEVADKALNTPEARTPGSAASKAVGNVARATMNRQQAELERTERKIIEDPVSRRIDSNQAINDLGTACERFSREGNEALRRAGELPDGERYWLTGAVDRAEQTLRAVRRYLELGRSEIDAELQALLDSEV